MSVIEIWTSYVAWLAQALTRFPGDADLTALRARAGS